MLPARGAGLGRRTLSGSSRPSSFRSSPLGSLVNFCDCLMAGGASPSDHSEVGSSYIHFNFTPAGDKSTPSSFGDVPQGVMLDQPAIFLGGQGGAVGPIRVAYGTVIAAGSVLREDVLEEGQLIVPAPHRGLKRALPPPRLCGPAQGGPQQRPVPGQSGGAGTLVPRGEKALLRTPGTGRSRLRGRHGGAGGLQA